MSVKQVIVVRKDLNMRKGKLAAQVAHASLKAVIDLAWWTDAYGNTHFGDIYDDDVIKWLKGDMTKIVVGVEIETELLGLYVKTNLTKIPHALIQDAGKTEFKKPTYTALAIGPAKEEDVDKITGNLVLL
ncbi:unnamed protein product [marine sediment metagenome]|uniref:peptidyl-tRNA hydrolase n=1 Tax=marine sediment metagenome TaxID=412755 RepID=X1AL82_9ZZZZ